MRILITGSGGLIGSAAVRHFDALGHQIVGIDNNFRREFFGPAGDTSWTVAQLRENCRSYRHLDLDIRDRAAILACFERERFDAVIHCAAQPSHDRATAIPFLDFEVNAVGTLNLLEANREFSLDSPFVFMSTNKVYGDRPNALPLRELPTRWDFADPAQAGGIDESLPLDQCTHSLFGVSKTSADLLVQEYGRYFGMPTCCLRGGCLTGPSHSAVELHGFLSYLVKCNLAGDPYIVNGYKGKQVRDNIHSDDVARFIELFLEKPKTAAVYNIGGGKANSISILEAFALVEEVSGRPMRYTISQENRKGDHICYYSDLSAIRRDYPAWNVTIDLPTTIKQIAGAWRERLAGKE